MTMMEFWLVAGLLLVNLLLLTWLLLRKPADSGRAELLAGMAAGNDRLERELRREISDNARSSRKRGISHGESSAPEELLDPSYPKRRNAGLTPRDRNAGYAGAFVAAT